MKLAIDFPEKDYKFMRDTYKETGITFVPEAIKNECVKAVYNSTPYERKTGKWIRVSSDTFKCSLCGNFLNFRGVNAGRGDANYCPNCGKKLEKEDENG